MDGPVSITKLVIETAKTNEKNSYEYLKLVFERAADMKPGWQG
jgi:hypothetical protein